MRVDIDQELMEFVKALNISIDKHGDQSFNSVHEGLGICHEELYELTRAIHENDDEAAANEFRDLAIAGFWGYVSIKKKLKSIPPPDLSFFDYKGLMTVLYAFEQRHNKDFPGIQVFLMSLSKRWVEPQIALFTDIFEDRLDKEDDYYVEINVDDNWDPIVTEYLYPKNALPLDETHELKDKQMYKEILVIVENLNKIIKRNERSDGVDNG